MRHRVPETLQRLMARLEERTRDCTGLNLSIAIDYGGRDEMARALKSITAAVSEGVLAPGSICEGRIGAALDTRDLPDPDLIIRTSGERRVSNFLLWQGAYAEYAFMETPWPEFTAAHLDGAVSDYRARQRRFGGLDAAPMPRAVSV